MIWDLGLFVFCGLLRFSFISEPRKGKREKEKEKRKLVFV